MAVGDTQAGVATIAIGTTSTFNIQPPAGQEWVIHNVYYDAGLELRMTNGTITVPFDTDTAMGARMGMSTHVMNGYYLQLRNTSASVVVNIAYDGVQTK